MKSPAWVLPHDSQQRRWFALLSVTAGVCEEWVLRGVVHHWLNAKAGVSINTSLLLSSLLFGWNHLYQGGRQWEAPP
jgi:membrane protease YdiL (CAAX protease family)